MSRGRRAKVQSLDDSEQRISRCLVGLSKWTICITEAAQGTYNHIRNTRQLYSANDVEQGIAADQMQSMI